MKAGKVIYFLGPEGAGKSTNINMLIKFLRMNNVKKVKIAYVRTRHFLVRLLFKPFVPEYFSHAHDVGTWAGASHRELRLYPLIFLLEVFNAVLETLFSVTIFYAMGYTVICEDFLIDTICDLERDHVRFRLKRRYFMLAINILLRLIPRNTMIIFLNADYEELKRRYALRDGKVEPYNYISIRVARSLYYFKLFKKTCYIDTTKQRPLETFNEVINCLRKEKML